jgi:ketosteroid isomerase-like protein
MLNNWIEAFALFHGPLGVEVRDITIAVGDDVACAHSFNRLSGTLKNGTRFPTRRLPLAA